MSFRPDHELHRRRFGRNLGLGLVLAAFVALVFALTVVKVKRGDPMQGYDHVVQPGAVPAGGGGMMFPRLTGANRTLVQLLSLVATLVFVTIVVIPPFYDWFCRVTGFGGTTAVAEAGAERVLERTVKVRFDASLEQGMPWDFRPVEHSMTIRIGETGLAFYEAHNPAKRPVAGTASFNVYPYAAGGYFTKIECFCFQEQVLQPGETVRMPVSFYIDPAMVDDPEATFVQEIVLSYTFHETPLPEEQAALTPSAVPETGAQN